MVRDSDMCTLGASQLPHIHPHKAGDYDFGDSRSPIGAAGTAAEVSWRWDEMEVRCDRCLES